MNWKATLYSSFIKQRHHCIWQVTKCPSQTNKQTNKIFSNSRGKKNQSIPISWLSKAKSINGPARLWCNYCPRSDCDVVGFFSPLNFTGIINISCNPDQKEDLIYYVSLSQLGFQIPQCPVNRSYASWDNGHPPCLEVVRLEKAAI